MLTRTLCNLFIVVDIDTKLRQNQTQTAFFDTETAFSVSKMAFCVRILCRTTRQEVRELSNSGIWLAHQNRIFPSQNQLWKTRSYSSASPPRSTSLLTAHRRVFDISPIQTSFRTPLDFVGINKLAYCSGTPRHRHLDLDLTESENEECIGDISKTRLWAVRRDVERGGEALE